MPHYPLRQLPHKPSYVQLFLRQVLLCLFYQERCVMQRIKRRNKICFAREVLIHRSVRCFLQVDIKITYLHPVQTPIRSLLLIPLIQLYQQRVTNVLYLESYNRNESCRGCNCYEIRLPSFFRSSLIFVLVSRYIFDYKLNKSFFTLRTLCASSTALKPLFQTRIEIL
uniref:Uncharacterized protein n=1 Tax=Strigamia maritima TaxID=126957 RepID=T1IKX0_STRMM